MKPHPERAKKKKTRSATLIVQARYDFEWNQKTKQTLGKKQTNNMICFYTRKRHEYEIMKLDNMNDIDHESILDYFVGTLPHLIVIFVSLSSLFASFLEDRQKSRELTKRCAKNHLMRVFQSCAFVRR